MANILYRKQKQQKSLDNGVTWIDTGEYRVGAILEKPSNCSSTDSKQCRWVELDASEGYYCNGYAKYTVQVEECTENGILWTRTGNQRQGYTVIDGTSEECGYIPEERWVVSGDPIVCECGSVIYYEYREIYDDATWKPTGEKRETEDFAITSGWTCYEESWDEGTDVYTTESVKSIDIQAAIGSNDMSDLLDYLYYNNDFIMLAKKGNKSYYIYGENKYDFNIYLDSILYVFNNYIYLTDGSTLYKVNFGTNNLEKVLDNYITYYGYDIIYADRTVPDMQALTFYIFNLESGNIINSKYVVNSPDQYVFRNMRYNEMWIFDYSNTVSYNPCNKTFNTTYWNNIGLQIGQGVMVDPSNLISKKENIKKQKFYVVNGGAAKVLNSATTYSDMSIYYINAGWNDTTLRYKFYHNQYKTSKHFETSSFVYKGNTIVNDIPNLTSATGDIVNHGIYNLSTMEKINDLNFSRIKLTDNDDMFCCIVYKEDYKYYLELERFVKL